MSTPLEKRINRRLAKHSGTERLIKTRGSKQRDVLGEYYLLDKATGKVIRDHVVLDHLVAAHAAA